MTMIAHLGVRPPIDHNMWLAGVRRALIAAALGIAIGGATTTPTITLTYPPRATIAPLGVER